MHRDCLVVLLIFQILRSPRIVRVHACNAQVLMSRSKEWQEGGEMPRRKCVEWRGRTTQTRTEDHLKVQIRRKHAKRITKRAQRQQPTCGISFVNMYMVPLSASISSKLVATRRLVCNGCQIPWGGGRQWSSSVCIGGETGVRTKTTCSQELALLMILLDLP